MILIKLLKKEIKDFRKRKSMVLFYMFLFSLLSYSFYSAVTLYSNASKSALNNPAYAKGFEPVEGIFVPTFGAIFFLFSTILPFLLTSPISEEKQNKSLFLTLQLSNSCKNLFLSKVISSVYTIFESLLFTIPLLFIWAYLGGHIPVLEILLLYFGYLLYGLFVLAVSFFSSSIFEQKIHSTMLSLAIIVIWWFIDFGKEMNIHPVFNKLVNFSITKNLKYFENGILSLEAVLYILLLSLFFLSLSYIFFNINIKEKLKTTFIVSIVFIIFSFTVFKLNINYDLTESHKNSFSKEENHFLKKLPEIKIKIFLSPQDSRFKDYENDFLRKLLLIKSNVRVVLATDKELQDDYGVFEYEINNKKERTYSTNEYEILRVLEDISGTKIKKSKKEKTYSGYPLIVRKNYTAHIIFIYFFLLPSIILFLHLKKYSFKSGGNNEE